MRNRASFAAVVVLLVAALSAPPAALLRAWQRDEGVDLGSVAPAAYVLGSSARSVTIGARAAMTWGDPALVRAPAWSGLVTAVLVGVGHEVGNGTPIAKVSGVEVRNYVLPTPIFRSVCQGDSVLLPEVRAVLQAAGLETATSARLGSRDLSGIRKYAQSIGVEDWRDALCFDPTWITVSPAPLGPVAEVGLSVGAPAPAEGDAVVTGAATLRAFSLVGDSGAASIDDRLTGDGAAVLGGSEIVINGRVTGVDLNSLHDPVALATLATHVGPPPSDEGAAVAADATTVAVRLLLGDTQFVVPATSVLDPLGPQACIVRSDTGEPVAVDVVASSISGLIIDVRGDVGQETSIRISPGSAACG